MLQEPIICLFRSLTIFYFEGWGVNYLFENTVNLTIYSDTVGVPKHLNMDRIKEDLMKIEDVYSIEDLNVWSLTAGKTSAIVHLQLGKLLHSTHII